MMKKFTREELYKLIDGLLKGFEVIGPRELAGKGISYQAITATPDLYLGDGFTLEPVKKFFFSPSEYLFAQANGSWEEMPLGKSKRVIFGVRPCEARGLTLLDKIFDAPEYADDSYVSRRKNTAIIGLSCLNPGKDCFCTSLGGSPLDGRGMDALIFACAERFIAEIATEKGKEIFSGLGKDLTTEEREAWLQDKKKRKTPGQINLPESLDAVFKSDYWRKVSFACIGCGICTYLCPTCHCFDLADEGRRKLRCYDGCAFGDFTREASGVNPRLTKKERYRQRVFHKFDYFKKNFGENLCVGCARCIRHCPVKMDISEIVRNVSLEAKA